MILLIIYWAVLFLILVVYTKPSSKVSQPLSVDDIHVVIPVRDEQENQNHILENSKLFQENGIQITIIDDHSDQPVEEYLSMDDISLFHATQKGKYNAINEWAHQIQASYIWIVDADMILDQKTITQFLQQVDPKKTYGFVSVVHPQPQKFWQYFVWAEQILLQRAAWIGMQTGQPSISNAACTIISRKKYLEVFTNKNIEAGGDVLLSRQIEKRKQLMLPPNFNVKTEFLKNFQATIKQRKRWLNNQKQMRWNPGVVFGYLFWCLLLFAAPVITILFACTFDYTYLAVIIPVFIVLGVFSRPFYSFNTFFAIALYAIFGWMYQCIQFILVIFGRS